jgi:hypothetical protein
MKRFLPLLIAVLLAGGAAHAQLALPGALGPSSDAAPAKAEAGGTQAGKKKAPRPTGRAPATSDIVDRSLRLNGADGELRFSSGGKDKPPRIEKFTLMGEVISDPLRKCRIDIVAQTPIEAASQGAPDGLARYSADIPACPLTFDVMDGAVLVPAQTTTCVFQSADCQANPSGLWGPEGASLEDDAKRLAKERTAADSSIAASLRILQKRDKGASAAALARDQTDFAAQRDDICHDYAGEARHGFCATRLTQARAALLRKHAEPVRRKKDDAKSDD